MFNEIIVFNKVNDKNVGLNVS